VIPDDPPPRIYPSREKQLQNPKNKHPATKALKYDPAIMSVANNRKPALDNVTL